MVSYGASRGSGKTTTAVHYAIMNIYEKNHILLANIHLTNLPPEKFQYMPAMEIIKKILAEELTNVTVLLDEIHLYFNSLGEEKDKVLFCLRLFYQARKLNVDVFYTAIRFMDIHIRLREQSEIQLLPQKYHYKIYDDGIEITDLCPIDTCKELHVIKVFCLKPFWNEPIAILNPVEVGKYFDTNEFVKD
jgi:hypothetical protein